MKKAILILLTIGMLTSCTITQDEIDEKQKLCDLNNEIVKYNDVFGGSIYCGYKQEEDKRVMKCIREYTEGIDQKYNNPDHVTNLREDQYSNVVKTCNDIFGEKLIK